MTDPGVGQKRIGSWRRQSSRGSTTLEAVIVLPVLLLIILVAIAAGRVALAKSVVASAASAGARAASLERTAGEANQASQEVTAQTIHQQGLKCIPIPIVVTDVSGFSAPLGTPATVTTTVTCTLSMGDLLVRDLPGSVTVTKSRVSVIDSYRER